jgi:hypothetical protein
MWHLTLQYCLLNESFWVKESLNKYIKCYGVMAALSARGLRAPVFLGSHLHAKLGAARLLPAHSSYTDPSGDINDTSILRL